jgi:hypothetical protein
MKETAYSPTIHDLIKIKYWIATASYREFPPHDPGADYGYGIGVSPAQAWVQDCDWVKDRLNSAVQFLIELEMRSMRTVEPVEDPEIIPEPALQIDDRDDRVYGDGVHKFGADY